jgi:hypothetical protein
VGRDRFKRRSRSYHTSLKIARKGLVRVMNSDRETVDRLVLPLLISSF